MTTPMNNMNGSFANPYRGPLGFLKAKESKERIQAEFTIAPVSVTGRELTINAGEVLIDIKFPVWFVEIPNITFGGELVTNGFVEDRKFPTVSLCVVEWLKKYPERLGGGYFVGARVAAVTTGRKDQQIWVHWRAEGKGMRTPLLDMNDTAL